MDPISRDGMIFLAVMGTILAILFILSVIGYPAWKGN